MTQLSKHFTLEEMTKSETARLHKIENKPNDIETAHLQYLCLEVLEPLRNYLQQPIIITSGYRCKKLNAMVGGVKTSYHVKGMAADIAISGPLMAEHCNAFLQKLQAVDQVIYEEKGKAKWLHVNWSYAPRHEFLKILK